MSKVAANVTGDKKVVSLVKGEHRFIFNYRVGQELVVVEQMHSLADNSAVVFDSLDAVIMSQSVLDLF